MPPQTQPNNQKANDAAASLGLVTTMHDHLLQYKGTQNQPQKDMFKGSPSESKAKTPDVGAKLEQMDTKFTQEISGLKEDIKKEDVTTEVAKIRQELEALLKDGQGTKN